MYLYGWKEESWTENSSENCFLWKNCFFLPSVGKKQLFFLRKQKFSSESFCPWIPLSTHTELIFLHGFNFLPGYKFSSRGKNTFPLLENLYPDRKWNPCKTLFSIMESQIPVAYIEFYQAGSNQKLDSSVVEYWPLMLGDLGSDSHLDPPCSLCTFSFHENQIPVVHIGLYQPLVCRVKGLLSGRVLDFSCWVTLVRFRS